MNSQINEDNCFIMNSYINLKKFFDNTPLNNYGSKSRGNNKLLLADKFIDGILSGKYKNDNEIALDLYKSKPTSKRFLMLKSRVRDQLLSYVYQIDLNKILIGKSYGYYFVQALKLQSIGQLMLHFGLGNEGEGLLRESLSIAKKFQATSIIIHVSRLLKGRVSYKGTTNEYNYYNGLIKENINVYLAEIEADDMRDALTLAYRRTFSPQEKKQLSNYWIRVNLLERKFKSFSLKMNKARIGAKYFETIGDFKGVIKVCTDCIKYMERNHVFYDITRHREFSTANIEACLILKDYKNGLKNAEICMKLYNKFSIHSVDAINYIIWLYIHMKEYSKAWSYFNKALSHPMFNHYPDERKEKWRLYEAYLTFVAPDPQRKFKLFKFLNEMPVFSKDKRGINIAIIIAQIILLLDEGKFDTLMDKADALNYRTFYFVKMLELLFKYSFDYKLVKRHSAPLYERLGDKEGHYQGDIEALEIIPYEALWAEILNRLKKHESSLTEVKVLQNS